MPNPAIATTNSNTNSSNNNIPWHKGKKRKFLILFTLIAFATVMAYITTKNQVSIQNIFGPDKTDPNEIVNTEDNQFSEKTLNNIANITIDEVREASNSTGVNPLESPSLSDEETAKRISEEIDNSEPVNHSVAYSDFGISDSYLEIKQGDTVTWLNASSVPMNIIGEGWQSLEPREPGDIFSYGFIFLGEYKYKVNDSTEAIINVVE